MLKWVGLFFLFLLLGCVVITLIGSFANRGSKATPTPTVAAIARAASAGTQAPTTVPPTPGPPTTIPPTRTPAPTKIPTATPLPTATLTTRASLNAELAAALGTSNRKVARLQNVTLEGNSVTVGWAINDNVTEGMIKTSANLDLIRILKVDRKSVV